MTVNQFIKKLESLNDRIKELPIVIDCPNGLQVEPTIKQRWSVPDEMFDKNCDKMVVTWQ